MGVKWYAVRAFSGQEKKVKLYLESEIERLGLEGMIEQIVIPTEKVYEMRDGKKRTRDKSLLPGYILILANLDAELIQVIREVPGIVNILGAEKGKKPLPLQPDEVNRLLGKVNEMEEVGETMENPFIQGENVKVIDGAFNGFIGVVNEIHDDKKKLVVAVKIFGRNTPLELSYLQVERIS